MAVSVDSHAAISIELTGAPAGAYLKPRPS